MTQADLLSEMAAAGYAPVAPDAELAAVDAAMVALLRCKKCESELTYLPFTKAGSYRAFALCNGCGELQEF